MALCWKDRPRNGDDVLLVMLPMWRFPKSWGYPSSSSIFSGNFPTNQPTIGVAQFAGNPLCGISSSLARSFLQACRDGGGHAQKAPVRGLIPGLVSVMTISNGLWQPSYKPLTHQLPCGNEKSPANGRWLLDGMWNMKYAEFSLGVIIAIFDEDLIGCNEKWRNRMK